MPKFLFFVFCFFMLSACSADGIPGVVTVTSPAPTPGAWTQTPFMALSPLPSLTIGPSATPVNIPTSIDVLTPTPTPLASPHFEVQNGGTEGGRPLYVIDAAMTYNAMALNISQEITYPNTSPESLNELVLAVEPNLIDGVFNLGTISINEQNIDSYTLDGQKLDVTLPAPLVSGDTLKLGLTYTLTLPEIVQGDPNVVRPKIFGVAERQVNLVDWYPFIVPYVPGTGWVLHKPWLYGEHLVYPLADFDVTLRFSDSDPSASSGQVPSTDAALPVVAASAAPEPLEDGTRYRVEKARNFSFSMGRQFQVLSQQIEGGVTIRSYYLGDLNKTQAQAVLDATVQAVRVYTALFGPYPHQTLSAVQGDFNDGMEFDGLYFLPNSFYNLYDNTQKNYLVMVAAHETSHQWWFGRVASDQAQEPWLDEALAMYCEKLFYEKMYPNDVPWWWSIRVDFYQPDGFMDIPVYDGGGFTPYTNATYRMGAHFLEDLRKQIGDEAFFAFLKEYATQMDGKISGSADFFQVLRAHTDADISALAAKYFKNSH